MILNDEQAVATRWGLNTKHILNRKGTLQIFVSKEILVGEMLYFNLFFVVLENQFLTLQDT